MKKKYAVRISVVTLGLLGVVAATSMLWPDQLGPESAVAAEPATIRLSGIVRDFRAAHPDFDVTPLSGYGHYAGNARLAYAGARRPALATGGFKVASQWQDQYGNPIAPHLYATAGARELAGFQGIATSGSIHVYNGGVVTAAPGESLVVSTNGTNTNTVTVVKDGSRIDGDVLVGPGGNPEWAVSATQGGTISGTTGVLPEPIPFPTITPPDLGPSTGDLNLTGNNTLDRDLHVDRLRIEPWGVLTIEGRRAIVCESIFHVSNDCQIQMGPDGALEIYVLGNVSASGSPGAIIVENAARLNTVTADPSRLAIYYLGVETITLGNSVQLYGNIYAPNAQLELDNGGQMWGNYVGDRLKVSQTAMFTAMGSFGIGGGSTDTCGATIDDTAGVKGADDTGGITSAVTFDEWYEDILGTNLSARHTITLTDNGAGVFEYTDDEFFPIDGRLLGNEGAGHNYFFTYELRTSFVYSSCIDQFFEFAGADDAWLYIDGKLAMDLGGIMPGTMQYVPIDRLDLVDGERYQFHFFYAQRQGMTSSFHMRTNLPLETTGPIGIVTGGFD